MGDGFCNTLVVGDMNANPEDVHDLRELMAQGWIDVGATTHCCTGVPCQPTCKAAAAIGFGTRRDYIFANKCI